MAILHTHDVVSSAVAGNYAAWEFLVDEYTSEVWSHCVDAGLSEQDATEVCVLVWHEAAQRLHEFWSVAQLRVHLRNAVAREAQRLGALQTWRGMNSVDSGTPDNVIPLRRTVPRLPTRGGSGEADG